MSITLKHLVDLYVNNIISYLMDPLEESEREVASQILTNLKEGIYSFVLPSSSEAKIIYDAFRVYYGDYADTPVLYILRVVHTNEHTTFHEGVDVIDKFEDGYGRPATIVVRRGVLEAECDDSGDMAMTSLFGVYAIPLEVRDGRLVPSHYFEKLYNFLIQFFTLVVKRIAEKAGSEISDEEARNIALNITRRIIGRYITSLFRITSDSILNMIRLLTPALMTYEIATNNPEIEYVKISYKYCSNPYYTEPSVRLTTHVLDKSHIMTDAEAIAGAMGLVKMGLLEHKDLRYGLYNLALILPYDEVRTILEGLVKSADISRMSEEIRNVVSTIYRLFYEPEKTWREIAKAITKKVEEKHESTRVVKA